jgi:hypothetical protein
VHGGFGEGDGETRLPKGRKVRPVPTLRIRGENQEVLAYCNLSLARKQPVIGRNRLIEGGSMETISPALRLEFREFCVRLVLRQIDDVFQMAGIEPGVPTRIVSGARRSRVEEYYASLDWASLDDALKFLKVVSLVLSQSYVSDEGKQFIRELCANEGLLVEGYQVRFPDQNAHGDERSFERQFPVGLPFGVLKPDFAITAHEGGQSLKFELKSGIGMIWGGVYPSFDFRSFEEACGITSSTNLALKKALITMNQTESEKEFFRTYAKRFGMADNHVPMLIPQAWIQWHSLSKRKLRASRPSYVDELYRVDFVAFWDNHRYAILIDDISHYAIKRGNQWLADEESYSDRLREDRKLQTEGWRVYRVSNWEIRDSQRLEDALLDLRRIVGFQENAG